MGFGGRVARVAVLEVVELASPRCGRWRWPGKNGEGREGAPVRDCGAVQFASRSNRTTAGFPWNRPIKLGRTTSREKGRGDVFLFFSFFLSE